MKKSPKPVERIFRVDYKIDPFWGVKLCVADWSRHELKLYRIINIDIIHLIGVYSFKEKKYITIKEYVDWPIPKDVMDKFMMIAKTYE